MGRASEVEAGRVAFAEHDWDDAQRHLGRAAEAGPLDADDCERLAVASYLTGRDEASSAAWSAAHRARVGAGDVEGAVRSAFWCGFGLVQRGDLSQGGGWMGRARALVEDHELDCVECGYLLVPEALVLLGSGECDGAFETFARAGAVARRFADTDLATLSEVGRGQARTRGGRVAEGMGFFDRAMVTVTSGEVSPIVSGIAYCAVVDECQQAFDVARAREWTGALDRWCDAQPALVPYRGQCLVHRSQVLQQLGDWRGALVEATSARERLETPPGPAVGMAHQQIGELHRLQGRYDEAEQAYRRAHEAGRVPQPGVALLAWARGDLEAALASIDAAVAEASDVVELVQRLPALVEIEVAAGRPDRARQAVGRLAALAPGSSTPYLAAAIEHAEGVTRMAEGDPRAALQPLRRAWARWVHLDLPYETARAQLGLAEAYLALGDRDAAEREADAARTAFLRLGAAPDEARARRTVSVPGPDRTGVELSARELQVLDLVAGGLTNRAIGEQLCIAEKTVERHVSNVFTKLGVSNRAAATAAGYERGVLHP